MIVSTLVWVVLPDGDGDDCGGEGNGDYASVHMRQRHVVVGLCVSISICMQLKDIT